MQNIENYSSRGLGDRFIPLRKDTETTDFKIMRSLPQASAEKDGSILTQIFPFLENNVLNFNAHRTQAQTSESLHKTIANEAAPLSAGGAKGAELYGASQARVVRRGESLVLSAPGFRNDYYLNLLDVHSDKLIGTILGSTIFLLRQTEHNFHAPLPLSCLAEGEFVEPTSLNFNRGMDSLVAFGTAEGEVRLLDWERDQICGKLAPHSARVGSLQWNPSRPHLLASGSKDHRVALSDTREARARPIEAAHCGEICGLAWNPNGLMLASGGNDNLVHVWDLRQLAGPLQTIRDHRAAVRALDWCPWRPSLLATGGGSGDMQLLVTDIGKARAVKRIKTNSQICALLWEEDAKGILTAHGFSRYQMALWSFPTEELVCEFVGHKHRVLSMVRSPEGSIFTGSADESIRVWNMRNFVRKTAKSSSQLTPLTLR